MPDEGRGGTQRHWIEDWREWRAMSGDPKNDDRRGFDFWWELHQTHMIGVKEGVIADELLYVLDLITELEKALRESKPVIDGQVNPIVKELRAQRGLAAKLISQLPPELPPYDPGEGPPLPVSTLTPRQERARKAAEARWSRPGARRKPKNSLTLT